MSKMTHGIQGRDDEYYWIEQTVDRGLITMKVRREQPKQLPLVGHLNALVNGNTIRLQDIHVEPFVQKHPKTLLGVAIPTKKYHTRNLGIGSALIGELKKRAKQTGATRIIAELSPKDLAARPDLSKFYKKNGFSEYTPTKFILELTKTP